MDIDQLHEWLTGEDGYYTHLAVIVSLLLGGFGAPIPEDIPLLLAGLAASKNIVSLKGIFLSCYFGVVLADQTVYLIGYLFGPTILEAGKKSKFCPGITEEKVNKIRDGLRRKRFLYIFLGRHLFPLRSATFITAGALRIPFLEFLISDAFAALISVAIMVGLGYWLGEFLTPEIVEQATQKIHLYITGFALFCLIVFLVRRKYRKNC